eukprot:m.163900 g.163900  ORF g.163900 m.163900 type:complete len:637 (-) comp17120_c0_seq4:1564-3474(-)
MQEQRERGKMQPEGNTQGENELTLREGGRGHQRVSSHPLLGLLCVWRRRAILIGPALARGSALFAVGLVLLGQLLVLLLDEGDQGAAASLQLSRCARLEEPVEAELRRIAHLATQLLVGVVLVIANLLQHADEEAVLLLGELLALAVAVLDLELVHWRLVAGDLGVQRHLNLNAPLDLLLAALNLGQDGVLVGQLIHALQQDLGVLFDLIRSLALNLLGDVLNVRASILLQRLEQLVEVLLCPRAEALLCELILLRLLLLGEGLGIVNQLLLGNALLLLLVCPLALATRHLVLDGAAVGVQVAIEQLHVPQRVELEVLGTHILGRLGGLWRLWVGGAEDLAVVLVDRVVLLALTLGRLDPENAAALLLLTIVLALKLEHASARGVEGEALHRVEAQLLQLLVHLRRLLLAALEDGVNVLVGDGGVIAAEDALSAKLDHLQHFVLVQVLLLIGKAALLNDEGVEAELHLSLFHNALFDCALGDETENADRLCLADAVGAILSLQISLRIPVAVVEDDDVGSGEVNAETACTGAEHEDELLAVGRIVLVDHALTVLVRRLAVEAAVLVAAPPAVVLQDVQHAGHLAEDEHARALLLQLLQQPVKHDHLAAVLDDVVVGVVRRAGLGAVKEVRVVGAFA